MGIVERKKKRPIWENQRKNGMGEEEAEEERGKEKRVKWRKEKGS